MSRWCAMVLLAGLTGLGCTAAAGPKFVETGGVGFVDAGGSPPGPSALPSAEAFDRARREALAARTPKPPMMTIERADARLRGALAALNVQPSVAAHLNVAGEYLRVGVSDEAYEHYTQALQLDPKSAAALDGRARLLRDSGLLLPALADAHRARYHAPHSAGVRNTLGTILERRGLCREALGSYREAARLMPQADWARANVARLAAQCP